MFHTWVHVNHVLPLKLTFLFFFGGGGVVMHMLERQTHLFQVSGRCALASAGGQNQELLDEILAPYMAVVGKHFTCLLIVV